MTKLESVQEDIVSVLRSNLTDPISLRSDRGQNWIFKGYPRYDSQTPRIGLTYVDSPMNALAIGSAKARHDAAFQLTILVRESDKLDIDSDGTKESAEFVADYISEQVISAIASNQDLFTNCWKVEVTGQNVLRKDGYYFLILELTTFVVRG